MSVLMMSYGFDGNLTSIMRRSLCNPFAKRQIPNSDMLFLRIARIPKLDMFFLEYFLLWPYKVQSVLRERKNLLLKSRSLYQDTATAAL